MDNILIRKQATAKCTLRMVRVKPKLQEQWWQCVLLLYTDSVYLTVAISSLELC